jgi:hypothetical protein
MSVIYNEYAPSARPHVAETQGYTKYYDHTEYSHNVFFMAIDELMNFYRKLKIIE